MNKSELVAAVATTIGLTKGDVEKLLSAILDTIKTAVIKGDEVQLIVFGSFGVKERAAKKGFNPKTKQKIDIVASKAVHFKAGSAFKEAINYK
jgi:DNA-binding protein HU-beta